MGTREGIFNLRTIMERYLEFGKEVYICFIDYEKAFHRVYHEQIMKCLDQIEMDDKDKRLIGTIYSEQTAAVIFEHRLSEPFQIKRGIRQGCVLSPTLFNLYTEYSFRESDELRGCTIGGINTNNLRYTDNTALIAESESELQELVDGVKEESEVRGLKMNVKKMKTMIVWRVSKDAPKPNVNIKVNGQNLEQVDRFKYLGQCITSDGRCDVEVKSRIEIAKKAFIKLKDVLTWRQLNLKLHKRLVQCYVLSMFLYASETWTLSKDLEMRIKAFELWIYRRMLKRSYVDRITNEQVLHRVDEKEKLLLDIQTRKLKYFRHLIRANGKQRELLEGHIEGKRGRGRKRRDWMKDIGLCTQDNYVNCVKKANESTLWRAMVANLRQSKSAH